MSALAKHLPNWQLYPASEFPRFAVRWDNLNKQLYQSHPMLDSRFVKALIHHFSNSHVLLAVYTGSSAQKDNFLFAEPKNPLMWTTFLPSQTQIAPMLCGNPQALRHVLAALPGSPLSIDILCQDPNYSFPIKTFTHANTLTHATTINIDLRGAFKDYWQQRSKKLQQNIRRYFNRLNKNNLNYRLNIVSNPEDLLQALDRYGDLETKSWKGQIGTAIHSRNEQGRFYSNILRSFASSGQAEIIELYLDGQLAASRINILNQNMLITLKTTYDENLANYAPGRLLLYLLIEREFSLQRVHHIEFYTNATPDQISWSSGQRNIEHLTTYRSANVKLLHNCLKRIKTTFQH
jgi:Acetyltransferase (GNAT) domain